ncbi:MAG: phosphoethanolamine transferase [Bacteroidaceae bacterium]|nr:phosphoethanolamine transferase [Bacteroidaceae bacterium]
MQHIIPAIALWGISFIIYVTCNKGLPRNCIRQQLRRYLIATIIASVPMAITGTDVCQPAIMAAGITSLAWIVTYPLLYHLSNRRTSTEYDNQIDPAFGIYLYGLLTSVLVTIPYSVYPVALFETVLFAIPVTMWGYYFLSGECVDINDMKTLQQTDKHEVAEFFVSWKARFAVLGILILTLLFISMSIATEFTAGKQEWWQTAIAAAAALFIAVYLWKPQRGLFSRTGIAVLYRSVKEYVAQNKRYKSEAEERIKNLNVTPVAKPFRKPSTIMFVLGESATRDYMSAFSGTKVDTTPWMRTMLEDERHCTAFPNAYSCHVRTVQVLEKSLTEFNQYDGGEFFSSCSIVDIAHKLGMKVHWYSNQGYVGDVDTPVTLVANTSDVAKWTMQDKANQKTPYDEVLLDYLDEVDPTKDNFLVLHLMGNHFNFINRYPEDCRMWGKAEEHDNVTEFNNSLHYTDATIKRFFEYAKEHLNLQAMVYMSDHGCTPTNSRRRVPSDFVNSRIPLMTWLSDEYIDIHPERAAALKSNSSKYWTNDLFYELMCGIFDIESDHFKKKNSLAHTDYCHTRESLTIMEGEIKLTQDNG